MMEIYGYPIISKQAMLAVVEDMRKTHAAEDMELDMSVWAETYPSDTCFCCAGGSVVIHAMGGSRCDEEWTSEQNRVAFIIDDIRMGDWKGAEVRLRQWGGFSGLDGIIPDQAREAWSEPMREVGDDPEEFFAAWEKFANALPEVSR